MVQRDYAARGRTTQKKKAARANKGFLIALALVIISVFAAGLYFLKEKSTESGIAAIGIAEKAEENKPKSTLPSRPEEVWSYIRDLETREIPIDNSQKSLDKVQNLTEEQKKILQILERDTAVTDVPRVDKNTTVQPSAPVQTTVTDKPKVATQTPTSTPATPAAKEKAAEVVQAKPKQENNTSAKIPTSTAKFGLQCGAFKNREQAENLQARLVMAGFDARVAASSTWNRIFIGPVGDRTAANSALQKAKSVAECVVVGM